MPQIKPFKAIRPNPEFVKDVACPPYDVIDAIEAKSFGKNEHSFLHVIRSEIDLGKDVNVYSDEVYQKAKENFDKFLDQNILIEDNEESYYIYRQILNGKSQTGICACIGIDDYKNNLIKKHEHTRPEKESDRIKHFEAVKAQTEPVFFAYKKQKALNEILEEFIEANKPIYDFESKEDGIRNIVWRISDEKNIKKINSVFDKVDHLYIADGHHRTASAYQIGAKQRQLNPSDRKSGFNYIMAVIFPNDELTIIDYNRIVKNIKLNKDELFEKLDKKFEIIKTAKKNAKPIKKHDIGMYYKNEWYMLTAKNNTFDKSDPVKSLDADILQKNLFEPILSVDDPRTNKNIEFIGGSKSLDQIKKKVDKEENAAAFLLYPVTIKELFNVADYNMVMPPKSTWFEPKLKSGLFIHRL